MARKFRPQVKLHPAVYEAWLKEDPKVIEGGPIELLTPDGTDNPNEVYFRARRVRSMKLPEHYAHSLMIYSKYNDYTGAMFHVGPEGPWDYMIAAHQLHTNGQFIDVSGNAHGNEAHYHEWDYYSPKKDGCPSKRNLVPSNLYPNMPTHELLEEFLNDYSFEDGRAAPIGKPKRPKQVQGRITNV